MRRRGAWRSLPVPGLDAWAFRVDDPAAWYCAVFHDLTGKLNGGYRHTGLDINLCKPPFGDVERGFPVYALAWGTVTAVAQSSGWLGVVQIKHEHAGEPLYTRYAHLDPAKFVLSVGDTVMPGDVVGYIGNWTGGDGGDHLHLDMALDAFYWGAWLQSTIRWIDPVDVLAAHLNNDLVTALLKK